MWHCKNLGDAMLLGNELDKIKQQAKAAYAPLFVRYVAKHGLHCEVIVYFPPVASELAKQCLASPCLAPDQQDLTAL